MAKKFVRGITGIKTINNQDFDTNNVNDLLSDGEHNYIHRKKKDKSEEYHNLTDNIKTISSDNTDLLSVTNYNKTTNSATLHPKHDAQKEQVLESTRNTITINHGANGTTETTKVDTNPQKVLEHDNLTVSDGLTKVHTGNSTNLSVDPVKVLEHDNLISDSEYVTINHQSGETTSHIQTAKLKEELDDLHLNKQNKLTAGDGISFIGDTISLKVLDQYNGNLNDLVYTCLAKPVDNVPNLPTGTDGNGILTAVRVGNVVSQKYHPFLGNKLYIRTCRDLPNTPKWSGWTLLPQA